MLIFRFVFVPPLLFLSLCLGVREYMPPNYMIAVHTYQRLPISLSCLRVWPVRRVSCCDVTSSDRTQSSDPERALTVFFFSVLSASGDAAR